MNKDTIFSEVKKLCKSIKEAKKAKEALELQLGKAEEDVHLANHGLSLFVVRNIEIIDNLSIEDKKELYKLHPSFNQLNFNSIKQRKK